MKLFRYFTKSLSDLVLVESDLQLKETVAFSLDSLSSLWLKGSVCMCLL